MYTCDMTCTGTKHYTMLESNSMHRPVWCISMLFDAELNSAQLPVLTVVYISIKNKNSIVIGKKIVNV